MIYSFSNTNSNYQKHYFMYVLFISCGFFPSKYQHDPEFNNEEVWKKNDT